jgi:hypothetical protein
MADILGLAPSGSILVTGLLSDHFRFDGGPHSFLVAVIAGLVSIHRDQMLRIAGAIGLIVVGLLGVAAFSFGLDLLDAWLMRKEGDAPFLAPM